MTKKLILICKSLDRKGQREMVNHLSPFLFPICRRYSNSFEDAKDLLQEALILIFNNMDKCHSDEVGPFKSWCKKITINNALAKLRKKSVRSEAITDSTVQPSTVPNIYSQLNIEDILKLLQQLPDAHRTVFNLAILDGYTHREIADILEIKESSSRTFLVRARQSLQRLIRKQGSHLAARREEAPDI